MGMTTPGLDLALKEVKRRYLEYWWAFEHTDLGKSIVELETELAALKEQPEAFGHRMTARAYERLNLCPDHRDKANGQCIVCVAEKRTKAECGTYGDKRGTYSASERDNEIDIRDAEIRAGEADQ